MVISFRFLLLFSCLVVFIISCCYGQTSTTTITPPNSLYAPAFRTSIETVGCGVNADWFQTPCFNSRQYATQFYFPNNTKITQNGFLSLSAAQKTNSGGFNVYGGLDSNYILNILVPTGLPIGAIQTIVPAGVPTNVQGNWAVSVIDSAQTMVFFGSQHSAGAAVIVFSIDTNGNLTQSSTPVDLTGTGLTNLSCGYFNPSNGAVYLGGSNGVVVKVDSASLLATVVDTGGAVGGIQCITGSNGKMTFASDQGELIAVQGSTSGADTLLGSNTIPNEAFGGACGATATYTLFAGFSSGNIYQVSIPGVQVGSITTSPTTPTVLYSLSNLLPNGYYYASAMNQDRSAFYIASTQASLPLIYRVTETIYEFRLYSDRFDYNSAITNSRQNSLTNIYAAASINNNIIWGTQINQDQNYTSGQNLFAGGLFFMVSSSLSSLADTNYLLPNRSIPVGPSSAIGVAGSIADAEQFIQSPDLLVACGIGQYPGTAPNPVPPRGPITTYLRGSTAVGDKHGGNFVNNQTMAIRLVAIDELSQNYFAEDGSNTTFANSTNHLIYRSVPFFDSSLAPWTGTIEHSVMNWVLGSEYPYPVPPNIVVNKTNAFILPPSKRDLRTPQQVRRAQSFLNRQDKNAKLEKRLNIAGSSLPGYSAFNVNLQTFDTLFNPPVPVYFPYDPAHNGTYIYNTTTRTLQYTFTLNSWTFLQFPRSQPDVPTLRLNLALGFGSTGSNLAAVTTTLVPYYNITGSTFDDHIFAEKTTFQMGTCYWTLFLPQVAFNSPGGLIPTTYPTTYDNQTGIISVYLPNSQVTNINGQPKGPAQSYTFFVEYEYNPPPSFSDNTSHTPLYKQLIPLYVVVGFFCILCFCIVCIALTVGLIVGIVKYRRWKDKTVEDKFSKSEKMLGNDL